MTRNAARREKFRKIGQAITAQKYVADPNIGLCQVHPWRVRKSDGFQVMQIVSDPGPSNLERRSLETEE